MSKLLNDEETVAEICNIFGVFPEELEYDLPGGIGKKKAKKLLGLINTQKRLYAESVLDEVLVAIDKNIEASEANLKYARDHNNSDRTIANWKGCIEGEKFIKDDVIRLRAEQRGRIE